MHLMLAVSLAVGHLAGVVDLTPGRAEAATSIAQTYYTPFEAQQYIDLLRSIVGDPLCCSTSVDSTISVTSGADANTVVYDHFEDGFEVDPFAPLQASTVTLSLDAGDVWVQSSLVPIDQPGRGGGNYYDGGDKIISTAPIAVTQAAFASDPGTVHAGAVQVLDIDKSGLHFDVPIGQNANYNELFDYVGMIIVGTAANTTVDIDADANGSFETQVTLGEAETYIVNGGVLLGAEVHADKPVSVYVASGNIGATYEGRFLELYPTNTWSSSMVSPVGSQDFGDGRTRAFFYNPGASAIIIDVTTGSGSTAVVNVAAGGQGSFVLPLDQGARFVSRGGEPFYGMQAITTEGVNTWVYDWAFTLVPENAITPSVIIPYGPGSDGLSNNYSPVWVAADTNTRIYVDLDGDPTTGTTQDPNLDWYDFHCDVNAYESWNMYDDGTGNCYRPSQSANQFGGDRDMTGARLYVLGGSRLSSAWGQRPNYVAGDPALDMGTTILPFPAISLTKGSVLSNDVDGDGLIDSGDQVTYTMTMQNLGLVDVGSVVLTDEDPLYSSYVPGSTTLDAVPQADDVLPFSASPMDADSPAGGLNVGSIPAGATRVAVFTVQVDDPVPMGVNTLNNLATMTTAYGSGTASVTDPLDVPPLQIIKTSLPSASPVTSGDTIAYTVVVYNADPGAQSNLTVTDVLPTGTTYVGGSVAADVDGVPIVASGPPTLVSGLTLNSGSYLTIGFSVTADTPMPPGTTEFTNTASVSSTEFPVPVSDDAVDPAGPSADLRISKDDNTAVPLGSGDPLTYTIVVTNDGPDEASSVQVVDTLPGDVTFNGALSDPSCSEGPVGTITCNLGDLGLGASAPFDIVVDIGGAFVGNLSNLVVVSSPTPDPNPGNNSDTEITPVEALPTLSVLKTPSVGSVPEPGGTVTFSVQVTNTSAEDVTLNSLSDDVFGDLLNAGNPAVSNNTCPAQPTAIPAGNIFSCSFDADLVGDATDPDHVDTVTAQAGDGEGNTASDDDLATVAFSDVPPTVSVSKTPTPGSIPEPGGTITFDIVVTNTSPEAVTLTSLSDDVFGDLLNAGNPAVSNNTCPVQPTAIGIGGTFSCSFDGDVAGDASGADHLNTATAVVIDNDLTTANDSDQATVSFADALPSIAVTKTPSVGSLPEPGGTVTFTVEVENTSVEEVTLTDLTDDVFGDLLNAGNQAISNNTCPAQSTAIPVGGSFICSFDGDLIGLAGDPDHVNTVTSIARDDEGNVTSDDGSTTVVYGNTDPTISASKTPSVGSIPEPGGTVTFTVDVMNTSVEPVTLTDLDDDVYGDLLDAGNAMVSNNTCATEPTAVAAGNSFSCSFDADVIGNFGDPDHVNVVTAVIDDGDGNTESDSDDASVVIDASFGGLSGHLFVDYDGNGVQDAGEPDLPDVDVVIVDSHGDEFRVTSDADGDWDVVVALGDANLAVDPATVPPLHSLTTANSSQTVTVPIGGVASSPIGYQPAPASVSGKVFVDLNGDLVQAGAEPSLEGITVVLLDASGSPVATAITDADGAYSFAGLVPVDYEIQVDETTVPDGYALVADPDGDASGATDISLSPGQDLTDQDFIYRGTGVIGDLVWLDEDGDGVPDPGELPLVNVTVDLVWAGPDGIFDTDDDWVFPSQATGSDGLYLFTDLPPGLYRGAADQDTVGGDMQATTPPAYEIALDPGGAYVEGDIGFMAGDTGLPMTGFDADRMAPIGILLVLLGLLLMAAAALTDRRRRIRWDRIA